MQWIDTHAHLDQDKFDPDRAEVIARSVAAGVNTVIAVGTTALTSRCVVELARQYSTLRPAVGIQPNYAGQAQPGDWETVVGLARAPEVVAIGETGLDRYWNDTPFDVQQDYFDRHLRLSQQTGLPFIVHTRECDADVLAMLREAALRGPLRGVMHSFTGAAETAAECVALGLHISFAGMVTFKKSDALRAVAAAVPADRILIETDSPYLAPQPVRGKRNEPAYVVHTGECVAAVRGVGLAEFAEQTTANARRLFRLDTRPV
jgi:TatD DNase family protein